MKLLSVALLALFLSGCGQRFVGAAYKVEFGRQITRWFDDEASTTYRVGAEFRFDIPR